MRRGQFSIDTPQRYAAGRLRQTADGPEAPALLVGTIGRLRTSRTSRSARWTRSPASSRGSPSTKRPPLSASARSASRSSTWRRGAGEYPEHGHSEQGIGGGPPPPAGERGIGGRPGQPYETGGAL